MSKKIRLKSIQQVLRRRATKVEKVAVKHRHKFFLTSLDNLHESRLLIAGWLLIVIALILIIAVQAFIFGREIRDDVATSGGTYAEGVIGEINNINPLFTQTEPEIAASRLVYSPLFSYDSTNHLRGEIAEGYTISEDGLTYTVKIRNGIKWHNGEDLTIDDVLFTLGLIKNPRVTSPLYSTWRNIKVEKVDDSSLKFTLYSPLASFPVALTFGILSKGELGEIEPAELREYVSENVAIGSGPYKYRSKTIVNEKQRTLLFVANHEYWRKTPRIENFYLKNYTNSEELLTGFLQGEVTGAVNISTEDAKQVFGGSNNNVDAIPLNSGVFAIFNMNSITDYNVRKALLLATNRNEIREAMSVGEMTPKELNSPIARGIFSSVDELKQLDFNDKAAVELIGQGVSLNVVTLLGSDYETVANKLAEQWRKIGVNVRVTAVDSASIQQGFLIPRSYDVLVGHLQLGADADVYAYWHSSGIKPQGLNLANYNSPVADLALFNARTSLDINVRMERTKNFVEQWLADIPAIALYQPNLYYLHSTDVSGITSAPLAEEAARYRDVYIWTAEVRNFYKTP